METCVGAHHSPATMNLFMPHPTPIRRELGSRKFPPQFDAS